MEIDKNKFMEKMYNIMNETFMTENLIFKFGKITLLVPESTSFIPYATFFAGEYDFLSTNKNDVILDAGSNIGDYAAKVAHRVQRVIAIEPFKSNLSILEQNLKTIGNITIVRKAVGNRHGKIGFSGSGVSARVNEKAEEVVTIDTLDSICDSLNVTPTILKMDIEGFEAEALIGFSKYIKGVRKVVIEIHNEENREGCEKFLRDNGFNIRYQSKKIVLLRTVKNITFHPLSFFRYDKLNNYYATNIILRFPFDRKTNIPSCGEFPGMYLLEAWK